MNNCVAALSVRFLRVTMPTGERCAGNSIGRTFNAANDGAVLAEAESKITKVYFPHSGIVSLVVDLTVGEMIETAMGGSDGVFYASALDSNHEAHSAICCRGTLGGPLSIRGLAQS
jgi:hypothetical protein